MSEAKKKANTDTTYCINEQCKDKCWRWKGNYEFEKGTKYWCTFKCIERIAVIKMSAEEIANKKFKEE